MPNSFVDLCSIDIAPTTLPYFKVHPGRTIELAPTLVFSSKIIGPSLAVIALSTAAKGGLEYYLA